MVPAGPVVDVEPTRRRLTERQAEAVDQLLEAVEAEAAEHGYEGVSVRTVARRAGVAPATAYTYVSSKDHLLAELLWRRLLEVPEPAVDAGRPVASRLRVVVEDLGTIVGREPAVVAACTQALLSSNPDVKVLRDRIGHEVRRRLAAAVGEDADPAVVGVLVTTYFGALLTAGMGHMAYDRVPGFVAEAARRMTDGGSGR